MMSELYFNIILEGERGSEWTNRGNRTCQVLIIIEVFGGAWENFTSLCLCMLENINNKKFFKIDPYSGLYRNIG